ncbi:hypothetical protein [Streptomyces triticisoli]|uniref:hypothetical protein n=1 Tax=Streptomyces triticisoli TaxID=2182797 RepID=UPI000DD8B552|nr:hypothetical protein [Streptomyces triticisoli]
MVRLDLPDPPAEIRRRPGAYGLGDSFRSYATCPNGYHEGSGRTALAGFRERLAEELGHGTNLIREALALRLVLPAVGTSRLRSLTADEDAAAATGLFKPVGQFRESRTPSDQARAYSPTCIAPAREVTSD